MAAQINLLRNTRVFFTTVDPRVPTTGVVDDTNTYEIQVMSDFTFSQGTEQQTITLNEAGATPSRGQRSFNTKINPVDWSFGTYIRPYAAGAGPKNATAPESFLWNALSGNKAIGVANAGWTEGTAVATTVLTTAKANFEYSNVHQLQSFGLIFKVDNTYYFVDKCCINQADISFGIDEIAQIKWAGQGATLTKLDVVSAGDVQTNMADLYDPLTFDIPAASTIAAATSVWAGPASFITNKLSVLTVKAWNVNGADDTYDMALTGGSLTISNNVQYLTPELLGAVNQPIGYFTGTRAISGSLNCYLKVSTGAGKYASELLSDLAQHALTDPDNLFQLNVDIGGPVAGVLADAPVVQLKMPTTMLQIPSVDVQDVVSATINFTAQSSDLGAGVYTSTDTTKFDITKSNELSVEYNVKW